MPLLVFTDARVLNEKGEFLNKEEGNEVLRIAEAEDFEYADVDHLGKYREDDTYDQKHIDMVLGLDLVDAEAVSKANFKVAFDSVNSVGGVILPKLLEQLGVKTVTGLFTEPTGDFQHNPEPLEKNLIDIKELMQKGEHDIAFVVDPDVDRPCNEHEHTGISEAQSEHVRIEERKEVREQFPKHRRRHVAESIAYFF